MCLAAVIVKSPILDDGIYVILPILNGLILSGLGLRGNGYGWSGRSFHKGDGGQAMRYWINTVSRSHIERGMEGGFTQANHGRALNLRLLSPGDLIAFYSPRTDFRGGDQLQQFTALARVVDEAPFQVEMTSDFHPWRRQVEYLSCEPASIKPLIEGLNFITDKQKWGFPFRRGLFEIPAEDFKHIALAMNAEVVVTDGTAP
jgi:hypothetical protein